MPYEEALNKIAFGDMEDREKVDLAYRLGQISMLEAVGTSVARMSPERFMQWQDELREEDANVNYKLALEETIKEIKGGNL